MKLLYSLIFSLIIAFIGTMLFHAEDLQPKKKNFSPMKNYMINFVWWFIPSFIIAALLFFILF